MQRPSWMHWSMLLYIRDSSIQVSWYLVQVSWRLVSSGALQRVPVGTEGQLKFWASLKLYANFWLYRGLVLLTSRLFKDQLYYLFLKINTKQKAKPNGLPSHTSILTCLAHLWLTCPSGPLILLCLYSWYPRPASFVLTTHSRQAALGLSLVLCLGQDATNTLWLCELSLLEPPFPGQGTFTWLCIVQMSSGTASSDILPLAPGHLSFFMNLFLHWLICRFFLFIHSFNTSEQEKQKP